MSAKQESETLMNAILPLAKEMLSQHGEFHPYGGYMKLNGEIVDVGAEDPDTSHPKSKNLISVLRKSLRELAIYHQCKAAAIVFDVVVRLPQSDRKSDAVQVCVEHVDGYCAAVFFPYQKVHNEIVYGETFAQGGKSEIFAVT